jgi:hypothetical protein
MRILVCGGRDFGLKIEEYNFIHGCLNDITKQLSWNYNPNGNWLPTDITIIHGGAEGTDRAASDFASSHFCQERVFLADWNLYGKRAGYIRNQRMLDEGEPDLVVAFPGGKGTPMMKRLALKAGVKVIDKVIDMGTKGYSGRTMPTQDQQLKTAKFKKEYIDRVAKFQMLTPGQKFGIFAEVWREEDAWLKSMGTEYDEIMQAQEIMDGANK